MCVCVCGGGGGSRPDCQKTALTTFLVVLNLLKKSNRGCSMVYQWFIFKVSERVKHFPGGGGPAFPGGRSKC